MAQATYHETAKTVAESESGIRSFVQGAVGGGFVGGYAFEKVRQGVNYEDSEQDALLAGLLGTAFSAPFVYVGHRQMVKTRQAALKDLETFQLLKKAQAGEPLTPAEHATIALRHPVDDAPPKGPKDEAWEAALAERQKSL